MAGTDIERANSNTSPSEGSNLTINEDTRVWRTLFRFKVVCYNQHMRSKHDYNVDIPEDLSLDAIRYLSSIVATQDLKIGVPTTHKWPIGTTDSLEWRIGRLYRVE